MYNNSQHLTAEENLLISLCRLQFNGEEKSDTEEVMRQVTDWKRFARLANEHGVIALVANNLKESGLEKEIPVETMAVLENGYMQTMVRNAWLVERWKEVNTILGGAGIKHILLKGMALEQTLYGAKGLRQMSDNDILVKREDALKAWKLLQKAGYNHHTLKSPLHRKILPETGKHLPSLNKTGYAVEIHHKLFDTLPLGMKADHDYFADTDEITVGDSKALVLQKEMHLKYLIAHFEKHKLEGNCQLRLYTDIMLLDKNSMVSVPADFIAEPFQEYKPEFRKAAYKSNICSIAAKHRLRFIIGDIFPSVEWMRKRHNCSTLKALLRYPQRVGKLWWLV